MGANIKIETLLDVVAQKWNLRVECKCGHVGVVDARLTWRWYGCHCWPDHMSRIGEHLWCSRCRGGRPVRIGITGERPNAPSRFPKDEAGWARLVRGLRG